jgi:hypothetical protein
VFVFCDFSSASFLPDGHNRFMGVDLHPFQDSSFIVNNYVELEDVFNKVNSGDVGGPIVDIYLNKTEFKFFASVDVSNSILSLNRSVTVYLHPKPYSSTVILNSSVCLIISKGTLNIDNLIFNGSGMSGCDMIKVNDNGILNIGDSSFTNNNIMGGDMIKVNDNGALNVHDSCFYNNRLTNGWVCSLNSNDGIVKGCDFVNNTAICGVVYIGDGCEHNKINYNRFFNNNGLGDGKDCCDDGGSDLNYNWWGVNYPLVDGSGSQIKLSDGSDFSNHFVVSLSAHASNFECNRTYSDKIGLGYKMTVIPVDLSYNFIVNSTGKDTNLLPYFNANVNGNNVDGRGHYTDHFNITSADSSYKFCSVLDGENIVFEVTGAKRSSSLKLDDVSGFKDDVVQLKSKLTYMDQPMVNMWVNFTVNGKDLGGNFTNSDGVAVFSYNISEFKGEYPIQACFDDDEEYASSKDSRMLRVDPRSSKLSLNAAAGVTGAGVTLVACLNDSVSNNPISNKTINFTVNGKNLGCNITDIHGVAVYHYRIVEPVGSYNIGGSFSADNEYNGSIDNSTLKVSKNEARFENVSAVNVKGTVSVSGYLIDGRGLGVADMIVNCSNVTVNTGFDGGFTIVDSEHHISPGDKVVNCFSDNVSVYVPPNLIFYERSENYLFRVNYSFVDSVPVSFNYSFNILEVTKLHGGNYNGLNGKHVNCSYDSEQGLILMCFNVPSGALGHADVWFSRG